MRKWYGSSAVCINKKWFYRENQMKTKSGPSLQVEKKKEKHLKHTA